MGLRNLERNIHLLEGFMELWWRFHDALEAVGKTREASGEVEQDFLSLKTEIARRQALVSEFLEFEGHFTDEVMGILSQIISLKDYLTFSSTQAKRIETQWHNLFILMHGQLGEYEASREKGYSRGWIVRCIKNPWVILSFVVIGLLIFYCWGQKLIKS